MKPNFKIYGLGSIILFTVLMLTSCQKEESVFPGDGSAIDERGPVTSATGSTSGTGSNPNTTIYGLSDQNEIVEYLAGPPATEVRATTVVGLDSGDVLVAIDIRPSNRLLYGLTRGGLLYQLDPTSGAALKVSDMPLDPKLSDESVAMDFGTRPDVLRVVTDRGQNLSVDPNTGRVISVDQNISPDYMRVNAIAYATNYFNTTTSGSYGQLYDLNISDGRLYTQLDHKGATYPIASTGLTIRGEGGFDIPASSTFGWAFLTASTRSGLNDSTVPGDDTSIQGNRLYSINLRTGATMSFGPTNRNMLGIAVP